MAITASTSSGSMRERQSALACSAMTIPVAAIVLAISRSSPRASACAAPIFRIASFIHKSCVCTSTYISLLFCFSRFLLSPLLLISSIPSTFSPFLPTYSTSDPNSDSSALALPFPFPFFFFFTGATPDSPPAPFPFHSASHRAFLRRQYAQAPYFPCWYVACSHVFSSFTQRTHGLLITPSLSMCGPRNFAASSSFSFSFSDFSFPSAPSPSVFSVLIFFFAGSAFPSPMI